MSHVTSPKFETGICGCAYTLMEQKFGTTICNFHYKHLARSIIEGTLSAFFCAAVAASAPKRFRCGRKLPTKAWTQGHVGKTKITQVV